MILFGTNRHAICIDDFYMFFRRTPHVIARIFYPSGDHKHRDWWVKGVREDAARNHSVDPIAKDVVPITVWRDVEEDVIPVLEATDFDYICIGNGTDEAHQKLIEFYGREKFLFSEYGWMPWNEHFYISRNGCGNRSEITSMEEHDIDNLIIDNEQIERFSKALDRGDDVTANNFIYVPLQKDVNDFKFLTSPFASNIEFLKEVDRLAPSNMKVLFRCHPLYIKKYDVSFSTRLVDITDLNVNKSQIYSRMTGMFCINSTSVLEAFCFGGKVVTFGEDIFLNKSITLHRPKDSASVSDFFDNADVAARCRKFVSLLFSRQISRGRCISNDVDYVRRHYWSVCI